MESEFEKLGKFLIKTKKLKSRKEIIKNINIVINDLAWMELVYILTLKGDE